MKLKLMQRQLSEESQVLDELKEKEDADQREIEALQAELETKTVETLSLGEELKKRSSEKEKAEAALRNTSAEFKTLLEKCETLKGDHDGALLKLDEMSAFNQRLLRSLKEKEEIYKNEVAAVKAETADEIMLVATLRDELKRQKDENGNLSHKLLDRAAEFKAALEKERAEFRLNLEKLEKGSEEAGKTLLNEVEALKESLRQKAAEAARSDAEVKNLLNQYEALKQNDEGRLLHALKEKEEVYKSEVEAAKSETAGKEALAASLREELKKQKEENLNLSHELLGTAAEYKSALEKERAEFRLNLEKMASSTAEAEKGLSSEVETLRDTLRQKTAELAHSGAQIQTLLNKHDAVKADYEARLLKLDGLNASVKEEVNKQKTETELLSLEVRSKAAEFKARLESEKAEAKNEHKKSQEEIRELNETIKRLQRETEQAGLEVAKIRDENSAIKAQRDTGFVKLTEQEIYAKSASSALKENREELEVLKDSMRNLSEEMEKAKADSRRRLELLRLELEEKNRQLSHLNREIEKGKAEKESLKAELAAREKDFNEKLEKQRKESRSGQEKNHGSKP